MVLAAGFVVSAFAGEPDPVATLRAEGCAACHPDGGAGVGPALAALVGRAEPVHTAGALHTVTVDDDYLRRALAEPDADVVDGYAAGLMPPVTDPARQDALLATLHALTPPTPASPAWFGGVAAGGLLFTGGHLLLAAARPRARLVARFGEGGFALLYTAITGAGLGLLVWAWSRAPYVEVWPAAAWTRWVPFVVMPFVLIAQVAGYSTPGPTWAGMAARAAEPARGIHRITRHPVNITTTLWAAAHLFPNGDLAGIGLFVSVGLLGLAGSLHLDARRAAADPEAWAHYAAQTSVFPFVAILQGRNRLDLRELGAWRILLGLAAYGGVLSVHLWLIGASPWPW